MDDELRLLLALDVQATGLEALGAVAGQLENLAAVSEQAGAILAGATLNLAAALEPIVGDLGTVAAGIGGVLDPLEALGALTGGVALGIEAVAGAVGGLIAGIGSLTSYQQQADAFFGGLSDSSDALAQRAADDFGQFAATVQERLAEAGQAFSALQATSLQVAQVVGGEFDALGGTLQTDLSAMGQGFDVFGASLSQGWTILWSAVSETSGATLEAIGQATQNGLQAVLGFFDDFAQQAGTSVQQIGQQIVDGIVSGLAGLASALTSALSDAIAGVNVNVGPFHLSAAGFSVDMPSLPSIQIPSIPGFASGTDFAPGGLAVVGEQGPELVSLPSGAQVRPLPDGGLLAPGRPRAGDGIVVNISGNYLLSERDLSDLAGRVGQVLVQQTGMAYRINRL